MHAACCAVHSMTQEFGRMSAVHTTVRRAMPCRAQHSAPKPHPPSSLTKSTLPNAPSLSAQSSPRSVTPHPSKLSLPLPLGFEHV